MSVKVAFVVVSAPPLTCTAQPGVAESVCEREVDERQLAGRADAAVARRVVAVEGDAMPSDVERQALDHGIRAGEDKPGAACGSGKGSGVARIAAGCRDGERLSDRAHLGGSPERKAVADAAAGGLREAKRSPPTPSATTTRSAAARRRRTTPTGGARRVSMQTLPFQLARRSAAESGPAATR